MSRSRHGKGKQRRLGVHRHRDSPEVHAWNRELLIPRRPEWMPESTYLALAQLPSELEGKPAAEAA